MPESRVIIQPSSIRGDYPERSGRLQPLPEILLSKITRMVARKKVTQAKQVTRMLSRVKDYSAETAKWSDEEFARQLAHLRQQMKEQGITEETVFRSFAMVTEMAYRVLGKRHYDVQFIGGWYMINGMLAEMNTGEGKTLTATLPACTAALAGIPVHVVTANDYLVERDASEMAPLYEVMGITVGKVIEGMDLDARREAYACDITYCTNKQLAFDYLRDRLTIGRTSSRHQLEAERLHGNKKRIDQLLLRGLCFAIVDEADSVLIDEARTPLVISQTSSNPVEEQTYKQAMRLAAQLNEGNDFSIEHKQYRVDLTEQGKKSLTRLCADMTGIWSGQRRREYLVKKALSALHLFARDKHYLCRDGKVQIIDEQTGRVMADRTWERGLHQLIELKEGCELSSNKETLAKISYQRFFRRYLLLAGMSGTVSEVASEMDTVYGLQVVKVQPHRPSQTTEFPDQVYENTDKKWEFTLNRIKEIHRTGRPILVGTKSVADSEYLSHILSKAKLPHRVLNARQDRHEADVIAEAGRLNRVTVATNMAGRGTDIRLDKEAIERGGLHVIATERHESRRVDRQLFGRCGRQGDPGSYEAIVSLDDELVKLYLPDYLKRLLEASNIFSKMLVNKGSRWLIQKAQKYAERRHKRMRRDMLKADDRLRDTLAFTGFME